MSVRIEGTNIFLTRGDSFEAIVDMYLSDGSVYTPSIGDILKFSAKRNYNDTNLAISILIPTSTRKLEITPSDTKPLEFGKYVYEIELTTSEGKVDTFISGMLKLTEEVD